ncbi:radical SAM protein [Micromonospora ureilytica]|nr:radical SAM protein [Micromonospora ureilytica]
MNLPTENRSTSARWGGAMARRSAPSVGIPEVVDANVIGLCQLRCWFCWGPEHDRGAASIDEWKCLLERLAADGCKRVVYTGGEPLLFPDIGRLLSLGKRLGIENTLSTNGILLRQRAEVLDNVDQVGIPIDGSDQNAAESMRPRITSQGGWIAAIEAMRLVQRRQALALIIRTVVSRTNAPDVLAIPYRLLEHGVKLDGDKVMLKLYMVSRRGPIARRIREHSWNEHLAIAHQEFEALADQIRFDHPQLRVVTQTSETLPGRYFLVDPLGNASDGELGGDTFGNVFTDYDAVMEAYRMRRATMGTAQPDSRR